MEYEVAGIGYAGPHETEAGVYAVVLEARPIRGTRQQPHVSISLLFRPEEIHHLAHMLRANLPPAAHDHMDDAIARLQT